MNKNLLTVVYIFHDQKEHHIEKSLSIIEKLEGSGISWLAIYSKKLDFPKWNDFMETYPENFIFSQEKRNIKVLSNLDKITGEYIYLVDGDDEINVKILLDYLKKKPTKDTLITTCGHFNINEDSTIKKKVINDKWRSSFIMTQYISKRIVWERVRNNETLYHLAQVNPISDVRLGLLLVSQSKTIDLRKKLSSYEYRADSSSSYNKRLKKKKDNGNLPERLINYWFLPMRAIIGNYNYVSQLIEAIGKQSINKRAKEIIDSMQLACIYNIRLWNALTFNENKKDLKKKMKFNEEIVLKTSSLIDKRKKYNIVNRKIYEIEAIEKINDSFIKMKADKFNSYEEIVNLLEKDKNFTNIDGKYEANISCLTNGDIFNITQGLSKTHLAYNIGPRNCNWNLKIVPAIGKRDVNNLEFIFTVNLEKQRAKKMSRLIKQMNRYAKLYSKFKLKWFFTILNDCFERILVISSEHSIDGEKYRLGKTLTKINIRKNK